MQLAHEPSPEGHAAVPVAQEQAQQLLGITQLHVVAGFWVVLPAARVCVRFFCILAPSQLCGREPPSLTMADATGAISLRCAITPDTVTGDMNKGPCHQRMQQGHR